VAPLFLSLGSFLLAWTSAAGNCGKVTDKRGDWNERGQMPEVTHRYFSNFTGTVLHFQSNVSKNCSVEMI